MKKEAVDKLVRCLHLASVGRDYALSNSIKELKKLLIDDEWIEHDGTYGCPVPVGAKIEVEQRDGTMLIGVVDGDSDFFWKDNNAKGDIIRYRIIEEAKSDVSDKIVTTDGKLVDEPNGSNMRLYNPKTHCLIPIEWSDEEVNKIGHFIDKYVWSGRVNPVLQAIEKVFGGE